MSKSNKQDFKDVKISLKVACVFLPSTIRHKIAQGKELTKQEHDEYITCGLWMGDQEVIDHWTSNPETIFMKKSTT